MLQFLKVHGIQSTFDGETTILAVSMPILAANGSGRSSLSASRLPGSHRPEGGADGVPPTVSHDTLW